MEDPETRPTPQDVRDEALRWAMARIGQEVGQVLSVGPPIAGTAPGWRLTAHLAGHGPVFLKIADGTGWSAEAVGGEAALITTVRHRHMPFVLAHGATEDVPWMVQRDLSAAVWPPAWPADLTPVFRAVRRVATATPPPWLPVPADVDPWAELPASEGPEPWRRRAEELGDRARRVSLAGTDLVHGDLGAGNLCISDGRPLLMDWSDAYVGNGDMDLVTLAVDVAHHEGRRVLPPVDDPGGWLAKVAGLLLHAAARPAWPGDGGAQVRRQQADLAGTAVDWALAALEG